MKIFRLQVYVAYDDLGDESTSNIKQRLAWCANHILDGWLCNNEEPPAAVQSSYDVEEM